jgi:UDP-N-acetylglucosamine 2-epimerase (non-hydrolysing)
MILITFGTRPEYIKVLPVMKEFDSRGYPYKTFFTGQHTSLLENALTPDHQIEISEKGNRLDTIVQTILNNEDIFVGVTSVMVQGDTTSAFATALAAFHRKIPVAHLEAGLRTYDKYSPYPEEFNRRAISSLAEVHFVPTEVAANNLRQEGFKDNIHLVGNTVLDNLSGVETSDSNTVIVTLHRREKHSKIDEWFTEINNLAKKNSHLKFILPIHPNPMVKKYEHLLTSVIVYPPMEHEEFISRLSRCKYIITDSGGIQEEAAFLKKPCIVCRDFTERAEGIGTFSVLCDSPNKLEDSLIWASQVNLENLVCPYGDGNSSKYIADVYKNL